MDEELNRLEESRQGRKAWKQWGPYLSERQWGTVREDYSESGDAWGHFSHDQSRSRAYRWGEDGIAGLSDDQQQLCFALALWNGKDPILKERLFGLTNSEGNHGEDVKEAYFYLDSTPTHSYMKCLYKYPQAAFPYSDLVETNGRRGRNEPEYELEDTGVFDGRRYFDVFVEYAKAGPDDLAVLITACNRGPERAALHLLPTLWFRNTWSWGGGASGSGSAPRPVLRQEGRGDRDVVIAASHPVLGEWRLHAEGAAVPLFTENESNTERLTNVPNRTPYVKDAFDRCVVHGRTEAVNPARTGTKAALHYRLEVEAGGEATIRLRLRAAEGGRAAGGDGARRAFVRFDDVLAARRREADAFYAEVIPSSLDEDATNVMRQALAGMLWSKQYYYYDVDRWLSEHGADPFSPAKVASRNGGWHHMFNADVISMPDKWEYPWYAAWDLAFHVLPLTMVDQDFGKQQLDLILRDHYLHPSGQLPAYEWNFGDVNPPVHAWAVYFTYMLEKRRTGQGDVAWLEQAFNKLLLNFTWWVNRKDRAGSNAFEGGFLGLDNIGVFDRSKPLPTGGYLEQADGTAWMAFYCQNMLQIAAELSEERPALAEMALKFAQHFLWISLAMLNTAGGRTGMWDEEDGFFYDVLRLPDGSSQHLKVRSVVGLLPLCAVTVLENRLGKRHPELAERFRRFLEARPELRSSIHDPLRRGEHDRLLASVLDERRLRRVLARMLDEEEFLSPFGIRSLSRHHAAHPFVFHAGGQEYSVGYVPAESDTPMFGGNSNWRGPIWMPINALLIRALLQYHTYWGPSFQVECPTGSGRMMNLYEVAEELSRRLSAIFLPDERGRRPVNGGSGARLAHLAQEDPHWRDLVLFYEYFHGDTGAGLGASHQTGWTGVIARIVQIFETVSAERLVEDGLLAKRVVREARRGQPPSRPKAGTR